MNVNGGLVTKVEEENVGLPRRMREMFYKRERKSPAQSKRKEFVIYI